MSSDTESTSTPPPTPSPNPAPLSFAVVQRKVTTALQQGTFNADSTRSQINVKNLLFTGVVTPAEVIKAISGCASQDWVASPHHFDSQTTVHVLKPRGWYIKFYFVDPDTMFISVHH